MATDTTGGRPVALVTGAARGIGLEVARQLAARGMIVLLAARGDSPATDTTCGRWTWM